jgi:hypothetical protein
MAWYTVLLQTLIPAQNTKYIGAAGGRTSAVPVTTQAQTPGAQVASPLFGRPSWTYTQVQPGPVRGPQPRLAQGSMQTGNNSLPGNASQLPGYLSDNAYFPTLFPYDPINQPTFSSEIPHSIKVGNNGRELVGTYQPHDFTPGTRNFNHWRQAGAPWVQEFPPDNRQLLAYQQVMRYRVQSFTQQARPLSQNDYFLGYQVNPDIQSQIGQSTLGNLGSS